MKISAGTDLGAKLLINNYEPYVFCYLQMLKEIKETLFETAKCICRQFCSLFSYFKYKNDPCVVADQSFLS